MSRVAPVGGRYPKGKCPVDGNCPLVNDKNHQSHYRHRCTFVPCPYLHTFPEHAIAFIHDGDHMDEDNESIQHVTPQRMYQDVPIMNSSEVFSSGKVYSSGLAQDRKNSVVPIKSTPPQQPLPVRQERYPKKDHYPPVAPYVQQPKARKLRETREHSTIAETSNVRVSSRAKAWEDVRDFEDGALLYETQDEVKPAPAMSDLLDELINNKPKLNHVSPDVKQDKLYSNAVKSEKVSPPPPTPPTLNKNDDSGIKSSHNDITNSVGKSPMRGVTPPAVDLERELIIQKQQEELSKQQIRSRDQEDRISRLEKMLEKKSEPAHSLTPIHQVSSVPATPRFSEVGRQSESRYGSQQRHRDDFIQSVPNTLSEYSHPLTTTNGNVVVVDNSPTVQSSPFQTSPQSVSSPTGRRIVWVPSEADSPEYDQQPTNGWYPNHSIAPHRPVITPAVRSLPKGVPMFDDFGNIINNVDGVDDEDLEQRRIRHDSEYRERRSAINPIERIKEERIEVLRELHKREVQEVEDKVMQLASTLPKQSVAAKRAKQTVSRRGSIHSSNCIHCKGKVPSNASFCIYCGKRLTIPLSNKSCSGCGTHLSADSRFCTKCGVPVQDNEIRDGSVRRPHSNLPVKSALKPSSPPNRPPSRPYSNITGTGGHSMWCPACHDLVNVNHSGNCPNCGALDITDKVSSLHREHRLASSRSGRAPVAPVGY